MRFALGPSLLFSDVLFAGDAVPEGKGSGVADFGVAAEEFSLVLSPSSSSIPNDILPLPVAFRFFFAGAVGVITLYRHAKQVCQILRQQ